MNKTLKDLVKFITDNTLDVEALLTAVTSFAEEAEEGRTAVEQIRHAAITRWVRGLRKDDLLSSGDATAIVCEWIHQSQEAGAQRAASLAQILAQVGSPVVNFLVQYLVTKHPDVLDGIFGGGGPPQED